MLSNLFFAAHVGVVRGAHYSIDTAARVRITCALFLLALPVSMFAQQEGLQVVLTSGEALVNVSVDSLQGSSVFMTVARTSLSIPVDSIGSVSSQRPGRVAQVLVIGVLAGAALGFVVGEIIDKNNETSNVITGSSDEVISYKIILPLTVGAAGGIIGAAVSLPPRVSSENLTSKPLEERKAILRKLVHGRGS